MLQFPNTLVPVEKEWKKATFWKIVSYIVNINLLHLYFRLYLGKFSRTFGEIEFIFKVAFGGYKKMAWPSFR